MHHKEHEEHKGAAHIAECRLPVAETHSLETNQEINPCPHNAGRTCSSRSAMVGHPKISPLSPDCAPRPCHSTRKPSTSPTPIRWTSGGRREAGPGARATPS